MSNNSEKKVRLSLRTELNILFLFVMVGMILFLVIINQFFLERVYLSHQLDVVKQAYRSIDEASTDGSFSTDEYDIELQSICDTYGIELIVLDADSQMIKSSSSDADYMAHILWDNLVGDSLLGGTEGVKRIIEKSNDYTIQIETDKRLNTEYLEIWGVIESGYIVMVRSALAGIRESVGISNKFMLYAGLAAIVIGSISILYLSDRITKPILQLSKISEEMKNLNFEAKYQADSKRKNTNEIDILGENINELSETLELTIKELKTANNELKQDIAHKEEIDEMRREFLSNVSHELKTPIALIQGYAEGLEEGISDDPESMAFYCDVIRDEASKMDTLVKKLLTLNQLEFGNDVAQMERFDITETIKNYVKSADILTKQKNAKVQMDDYPPIYVWADEFKTEEVLMNYYSNALNHLSGDCVVEIKLKTYDDKVRVSVFNTGEPIPEESIGHIWEKFYKVDKARTREYGGSGVGLSIVKAIMESMHQGYGVNNYDNGVEFWFELETR
ncbi:sensor histidine kinase [Butyrivibrio sp. XPD2002]|uniref:sensor histidine kinase n=1 Tax=Butyrivibrio sp. XPD2002 TaxID=1280665 RepID=UPI0004794FD1|nr:ATP-binding protein [Butyrivibrio sp. XPD2002]MCR5342774.1 HAMP domain-containing histidine kinase [Butyrivibrio sp.]